MEQDIVFKPSSELTFHTVQSDRKRLIQHLQKSHVTSLQIDLSQVKHCDSAGLALLIEAKRLCQQYHKVFMINEVPQEIDALAEFCGVKSILF